MKLIEYLVNELDVTLDFDDSLLEPAFTYNLSHIFDEEEDDEK